MFTNCQQNASEIMNYFASHHQNASLNQGMPIELVKMVQTYASKIEIGIPLNHFRASKCLVKCIEKAIFFFIVSVHIRTCTFYRKVFRLPISTQMLNWLLVSTPTQRMYDVHIQYTLLLKWTNVTMARHIIKSYRWTLTATNKVKWKHERTVVMCNNNRKIGVCKQTGAFVSNRNKKYIKQHKHTHTHRNDSTKQKNYTIRK